MIINELFNQPIINNINNDNIHMQMVDTAYYPELLHQVHLKSPVLKYIPLGT